MGNFFGIIIVRPLGLILMAIWSLVQRKNERGNAEAV